MIRQIINYSTLAYCFCCAISLLSTGTVATLGTPSEVCGGRNNFTQPYNISDSDRCDLFYTCKPAENATLLTIHCPPGLRYSPEVEGCMEAAKVNCSERAEDTNEPLKAGTCLLEEGGFLCKSGKQCINASLLCDGGFDCLDASDEFDSCSSICEAKKCSQICHPTPDLMKEDTSTAGTCLCRPGYKVSGGNPKECEDINECSAEFNVCSQLCENSKGSFRCSCVDGFHEGDRDNRSCQANDPNWKLLYATRQDVEYTSQRELEQFGKFRVSPSPGRPVAVTYDARSGTAYWTDASPNSEKIYRKSVTGNGSSAETIADTGIILPEGIAFDWITGNVYFADSNLSHIAVCGNSTNFCSVLVQELLDQPRDIALHPNKGIMLWTDWGVNPSISRAGMDGSFPTQIVTTDLKWPNGITIDQGSDRVYWVDAGLDKIETMLLDGRDRHIVISIRNSHPFGVDVFGDRVFWSDWNNFNIKSANKLTGAGRKIHVSDSGNLMNGLAVYHAANQPILRTNPCRNARCSHICTLSNVSSFRCLCPVGMALDTDEKTCVEPNNSEKLVIAFKNMIKLMRFDSIGRDVFQSIPFPELKTISAVVYNPVNHTIILSDSSHKKIYEYNINRKRLSVLIDEHLDFVKGMDIDVVGENLYWVDGGKQTVEVMSFRTGARKVLMTAVDYPYDILVVPKLGSLFVARLGRRGGKIYKMFMNGYSNSIFQRVGEKEPVGLAYDKELDNILWADKVNRGVETISIDGKSTSVPITHQPGPPSDVIKHGNQLYWPDMFSGDLKSVSLGTQYVRSTRIGSFESSSNSTSSSSSLSSREEMSNQTAIFYPKMTVINRDMSYLDMLLEQHECSLKNPKRKQCSHACVMAGPDFAGQCICPEGMSLDEDQLTCQKPSTCSVDQFTCQDGHCINKEYICDGVPDCSNQDDEFNCKETECDSDHFKCEVNGICISSHWLCDGESDCPDGADERNCSFVPCNEDYDFRCDSGRCIPKSWQCDHAYDCPGDDSDERGCEFTCPSGYFKCATQQNCIIADWVCDKDKDCEDGSDEMQNCDDAPCPDAHFTCNTGKCISPELVCDGAADCANNEDEEHCREGLPPNERDGGGSGNSNVTIIPVVQLSENGGSGTTVAIVLGVFMIIILVAIIVALVLHKRNIQPKILVRPYVNLWNRHVNEPARRLFTDGRRQQKLDCEMNEYDEVYTSGNVSYYNTNVYEEVDGVVNGDGFQPDSPSEKNGKSRSFADSGILGSERESLYEEAEDCGSHYVSYNQKDKLLAD